MSEDDDQSERQEPQAALDEWESERDVSESDHPTTPQRSDGEPESRTSVRDRRQPRQSKTGAEQPEPSIEGVSPGGSAAGDPVVDRIELGVELLASLEHEELTLKETLDRLETITADPAITREILDVAAMRGVIDREDGIVRPKSHAFVSFERDVLTREGTFECKRCGTPISTGYFIRFDAGEHGPFGSSCIRKVTGRD